MRYSFVMHLEKNVGRKIPRSSAIRYNPFFERIFYLTNSFVATSI